MTKLTPQQHSRLVNIIRTVPAINVLHLYKDAELVTAYAIVGQCLKNDVEIPETFLIKAIEGIAVGDLSQPDFLWCFSLLKAHQ